jgi:hypothetical protein
MPERIDVIHLSDLELAMLQQGLRQRPGTGPAATGSPGARRAIDDHPVTA